MLPSFVPVQSGNADAGPEVYIKGATGVGETHNQFSDVVSVSQSEQEEARPGDSGQGAIWMMGLIKVLISGK